MKLDRWADGSCKLVAGREEANRYTLTELSDTIWEVSGVSDSESMRFDD